MHEGCARLCGVVREEVSKIAPGLLVFRNSTRMGVFGMANDHDGSGQELLAQKGFYHNLYMSQFKGHAVCEEEVVAEPVAG